MPAVQATLPFSNTGSPSTSGQFGPLTITVGNAVIRARAVGTFIGPPAAVALPLTLSNDTIWGIQMGATGYTPKVLPADVDDPDFLIVQQRDDYTATTSWAPSSATAAYVFSSGLRLEWDGQLFVGATQDFYFTYGPSHGTGINATISGTLQVWTE